MCIHICFPAKLSGKKTQAWSDSGAKIHTIAMSRGGEQWPTPGRSACDLLEIRAVYTQDNDKCPSEWKIAQLCSYGFRRQVSV